MKPKARLTTDDPEYIARLDETVNLMRARQQRHIIVRYLRTKFRISDRTAARYIERARDVLTIQSDQPKAAHRVDAYTFYASIVADPSQSMTIRMRAQDAIVNLFGLATPIRVAQTDTNGDDVSPEQVRSELVAIIGEISRLTDTDEGTEEIKAISGPDQG